MNFSAGIGLLIGLLLIGYSVTSGLENSAVFLNSHAIVLVLGGTISAAFLCMPWDQLKKIFSIYFGTISGKNVQNINKVLLEVSKMSQEIYNGKDIASAIESTVDPFFKESLKLYQESTLNLSELESLLEMRIETQNELFRRNSATFKVIGKFPPAFGLIGATTGMISLLQGLGSDNAFEKLGPSMATALVATFYGLIIANIFLIPIGENLQSSSNLDLIKRRIVTDGVIMIAEKKHPILVKEHLKSYLPPKLRNLIDEAEKST